MENIKSINSSSVFDNWVRKTRTYRLVGGGEPPYRQIRTRHISRFPLLILDETTGYERELKYAVNQKTPFADEQQGFIKVSHIGFEDGVLEVPGHMVALQQFLLVHPDNRFNGGGVFYEVDLDAVAEAANKRSEDKVEALIAVKGLNSIETEYVAYNLIGSKAFTAGNNSLKKTLYSEAESSPGYLLDLIEDEFSTNKAIGAKALHFKVLKLDDSKRTVKWGSNSRKVCAVGADSSPAEAIADFFMTDEGFEVRVKVLEKLED